VSCSSPRGVQKVLKINTIVVVELELVFGTASGTLGGSQGRYLDLVGVRMMIPNVASVLRWVSAGNIHQEEGGSGIQRSVVLEKVCIVGRLR